MGDLATRAEAAALQARKQIERYVAFVHDQCRRALDTFLADPRELTTAEPDQAGAAVLEIRDLEHHARHWASLVPRDPHARAALLRQMGEAYPLGGGNARQTRVALGSEDRAIHAAYQQLYGQPVEAVIARAVSDATTANEASAADALRDELDWVVLAPGEALVRQSEPGDCMYLVTSGRLLVAVEDGAGGQRIVGEIGRDDTVGEMALITGEPRSATVFAARDSTLVCLTKATFDRLIERYPTAVMRIARTLVRRLQERTATARRNRVTKLITIALVPISPGTPLDDVSRALEAALSRFGEVLRLDSRRVDELLHDGAAQTPPGDVGHTWVAAWLNEQEASYRFVLYQADPEPSEWTRRCMRQADRVLLVGIADADPQPGQLERSLGTSAGLTEREDDLVLLHRGQARLPSGTAGWLAARSVRRHYHVRIGVETDYARLARRLSGQAVGLVLGSGAARGFTHIGVIRALVEADIPIDVIGGASSGALIAAQYALGWDLDTMMRRDRELARSGRGFLDWTLPIVSVFAGRRLARALDEMFGDVRIEDLWTPYFCTSSNLTRAQTVVHQSGLLRRYALASSTIPAFFPPVIEDGDMLIDGGVLNTVPVDVMRQLCDGGTVIAVDVMAEVDLSNAEQLESFSLRRYLWQRVRPFAPRPRVPSMFAISYRASELGSVQLRKMDANQPDLMLDPPVKHLSAFDARPFEQFVEIGYSYTRGALARWEQRPRCS